MTNEEWNRIMEFIIEQQAQFSADIHMLKEAQIDLQTQTGALAEMQIKTEVRLGRIEVAVLKIVDVVGQVANAQAKTDERLSAFINVVERYITGSGNGKK